MTYDNMYKMATVKESKIKKSFRSMYKITTEKEIKILHERVI